MGKYKIEQKATLHNYFILEVKDCRTGRVKQVARAENIILDQGFDKIMTHLTIAGTSNQYAIMRPPSDDTTGQTVRFGGYIHLGEGTGTLAAARTALFTFLAAKYTTFHDAGYDISEMTAYYTQKAVWDETELQNEDITEVGLGSHSDSADLSTHALIEDSEGNPITVEKGLFDILTVYSTVFIEPSHSYGANLSITQETNTANAKTGSWLLRWICDNGVFYNYHALRAGNSDALNSATDKTVASLFESKTITHASMTRTSAGKKVTWELPRVTIGELNNASGIKELGFEIQNAFYGTVGGSGTNQTYCPLFRTVFPLTGVWTGVEIVDEEIGTGDGSETEFSLQWGDIVSESETVKVDAVAQVRGTDYTINNTTGLITFEAGSIPGVGDAVTVTYSVEFIPKDVNHVIDIEFALEFADANA